MLLASPALASTPALHLVHFEDAVPSTVPLLAPESAALPFSFHLPALQLKSELPSAGLPLPLPAMPDEGGGAGVSSDVQPLIAILLSLFIGFGLGHLIVHDRDGFILFLVVDVVIIAVTSILGVVTPLWWLGYGGGGLLFDLPPDPGAGRLRQGVRHQAAGSSASQHSPPGAAPGRPRPAAPGRDLARDAVRVLNGGAVEVTVTPCA